MRRSVVWLLFLALLAPSAAFAQSKSKTKRKKTVSKATARQNAIRAAEAARARRIQSAFKASAELRPMAKQLLESRSRAAYAGVEKYAKRHAGAETGALAYLLLGYARLTDKDPDHKKAITALKSAKPVARDLGDYIDYHLASAHLGRGDVREAASVLDGFAERYPDSLLLRDAVVMEANALVDLSAFGKAIDLLAAQRIPARSDIELAIGKAYLGAGNKEKGLEALRNVYYNMPLSPHADAAGALIKKQVANGEYASRGLRKTRADLLVKGREYKQGIAEYRVLLAESMANAPDVQIPLGYALYRTNKNLEAQATLTTGNLDSPSADDKAQRCYVLAEIAREQDDDPAQLQWVQEALKLAPHSRWTQDALMSLANKYMLRNEYAQAILFYDEIAKRYPSWRGAFAHWKSAWLTYRMGKLPEAKQRFEAQLELYPASSEVANALYWRGRVAEDEGDTARARAYYGKLIDRFRNYYYTGLARERLGVLGHGDVAEVPQLARVPAAPEGALVAEAPPDDLRLQKARLLSNAALYDFAARELKQAADDPKKTWALVEIIKLHHDAGNIPQALQTLKRALPGYFAVDLNGFPKPLLDALFPRPYWDALARSARANELDPYLVASLIRQESEFNPMAVSHANAYGLMQLLPEVGRRMAQEIRLRPYSTAKLLEPEPNLRLGTRYFRQMIDEQGGRVEFALAAYNAGPHRVADWLAAGQYRDVPEFVESIPFTETREYVQSIMRNVAMYRQLYGDEQASSSSP